MRAGARGHVSVLIAVAITGLVFVVTATAIAASHGSSRRDSTVQACVATSDTVHRVTDGVDQATAGFTNPISQLVNSAVDGLNQATTGAVSDITESIAPASSVLIVPSGTPCPAGYAPQTLTGTSPATPAVDVGQSTGRVTLAKTKVPVAVTAVTSPGPYMVTATVNVAETGLSDVTQRVKCVLVDGGPMRAIPGTTSTGTFPVGSSGMDLTETITSYVPDVPVGELAIDCKDPQLAATTTAAARLRKAKATGSASPSSGDIPAAVCKQTFGSVANGKCVGGPFNGLPVTAGGSTPPPPPTATGNIQATSSPSPPGPPGSIPAAVCKQTFGSVANGKCVGGPFGGLPVSG